MKVGVVVTEVGPGIGGRYTFQGMLLAAVERLRGATNHQFVVYSAGISRYTEASLTWRGRRLAKVAATLAIQASRDVQDSVITKRLVHVRTPLERRLHADGIDLAWFPTYPYVEDVDIPFVWTVFDTEHRIKPWFPEVSAAGEFERRERLLKRYLPKATRVIVSNDAGREQVVRFYAVPAENCLPLRHPTPDFALRAADEPPRHAEALRVRGIQTPFLLYPAQFWPHKNHAAALDGLAELRSRGEPFSLVLVGSDKGQLDHVRGQVHERGLDAIVRILGFVDEEELIALYQHAHALLYVSRFGPENLPPLEAFALGCPAVVGDVPGARDQVGDAALIVDASNPTALADAVQRVGDPAERARLVHTGRERARAWTADDYLQGLIAFLDEFEQERRLWA
jgi:glycosyltransferase involved in cell wall biosynthesis